jgi:hypothetical protein
VEGIGHLSGGEVSRDGNSLVHPFVAGEATGTAYVRSSARLGVEEANESRLGHHDVGAGVECVSHLGPHAVGVEYASRPAHHGVQGDDESRLAHYGVAENVSHPALCEEEKGFVDVASSPQKIQNPMGKCPSQSRTQNQSQNQMNRSHY